MYAFEMYVKNSFVNQSKLRTIAFMEMMTFDLRLKMPRKFTRIKV